MLPSGTDDHELRLLPPMVLLATLATATTIWQRIRARRAGNDPSEQEATASVVPEMAHTLAEVQTHLMRLQTTLVQVQMTNELPGLTHIRHFDALLTRHRISSHLQALHQRLLSLYPAISAELAEEARRLWTASEAIPDQIDTDWIERLSEFVKQGFDLVDWTRQEMEVL